MIMKDLTTDLMLKTNLFIAKKGQDISVTKELIAAINAITGEDSLSTIYVNTIDNYQIPDVFVLPLYHTEFNLYLMNGDLTDNCPFGYTLEIHDRCFERYNAEELSALIIHDILQVVQSDTAKARFMKAYNTVMSEYKTDEMMSLFDDISNSEVVFMIFQHICLRPFKVPVMKFDYLGTDEVLKSMGLGDAYESYLAKLVRAGNEILTDPDKHIVEESRNDYYVVKTILDACRDKDIRHYYNMLRNGTPMISLNHIMAGKATIASMGFVSRRVNKKSAISSNMSSATSTPNTLTESFINPKSEVELRYSVDKIITEMRYCDTEDERQVCLMKIRDLTLKLTKILHEEEKRMERNAGKPGASDKCEYIRNLLTELEFLREKTVKMDIKQKQFGLFVKYPAGYEG